jgi:hypothetical protein
MATNDDARDDLADNDRDVKAAQASRENWDNQGEHCNKKDG